MLLKRNFALIAVAAGLAFPGVALAQDAGADGGTNGSGLVYGSDGGVVSCTPDPAVTATNPRLPFKAPNPKAAACSESDISEVIAKCWAANSSEADCEAFVQANEDCFTCTFSQTTEAAWGPLVCEQGGSCFFNFAGCFDLNSAGASDAGTSCGTAYWNRAQCVSNSCSDARCSKNPRQMSTQEEAAQEACSNVVLPALDAGTGTCTPTGYGVLSSCGGLTNQIAGTCGLTATNQDGVLRALFAAFCGGKAETDAGKGSDGGKKPTTTADASATGDASTSGNGASNGGGGDSGGCSSAAVSTGAASAPLMALSALFIARIMRRRRRSS